MRRLLFALVLLAAPAAAQERCADPGAACASAVSSDCVTRLGAGQLAADDACTPQWSAYAACLAEAVAGCPAAPAPQAGSCSAEDARQLWASLEKSVSADELEMFAETCVGAPQAKLAALRAEKLRAAPAGSTPAVDPNAPAVKGVLDFTMLPVDAEVAGALGLPAPAGVLVAGVKPDGAAAAAGVRAGDVVLEIAGQPVKDWETVPALLWKTKAGDIVPLTLFSRGAYRQVEVMAVAPPASAK